MRSRWIFLAAMLGAMAAVAACAGAPPQPTAAPTKPTAAPAAPAQPTAAQKPAVATSAPAQPTAPAKPTAGPSQALIDAAKAEGEVVWLGASTRELIELLAPEFTKKYGIKVNWIRKGGPEVQAQVDGERRAGKVRADVIGVGDPTTSRIYFDQGIIAPYEPESAALVLPAMRDPRKLFTSILLQLHSMVYNTAKLKKEDLPKTFKDLTDPRWKGRLGSIRIRGTGAGTVWAQVLHATYGWPYFEDLAKNKPMLITSAAGLPPLVLKGEADVAFPTPEADAMTLIMRGEPLGVLYGEDVQPTNPSIFMLVKDSAHPNAAKLLLDFMQREEFQAKAVKEVGMRSILMNGPSLQGAVPLERLKLKIVDTEWVYKNQDQLWNRFDEIFGFKAGQ